MNRQTEPTCLPTHPPHSCLTHAPPTPQLPYHIKVTGKATKTDLPGTTIWHCQFASFECPSKLKLLTKRDQLGAIRYVVIATGHHEHDTPGITHETRQIKIRDTIRKVVVDNWRPKTILNKRSVFDEAAALLIANPAWPKDGQPGYEAFYAKTMKYIESCKAYAKRLVKRRPFATESTGTVTAEQSAAIRSEVTKYVADNQRTSDGAGDAYIFEAPGMVFGAHGPDDAFAMQVHLVCRSQLEEVLDYTGRQYPMGIQGLCVNVDHTQAGLDLKTNIFVATIASPTQSFKASGVIALVPDRSARKAR